MQFTNDEIALIKSAALNRYLQLGFTEKDAEVLYGNFISNISNSKPKEAQLSKKAQLDEIKSRLTDLYDDSREGLTDLKARLSGLYDSSRERLTDLYENSREGLTDLTDKIPEDYRGALLGGGGGAVGGGLAGFLAPNNDAGFPARLARALRWGAGGALGGAAAGGSLDLNRALGERDKRKEEIAREIRAEEITREIGRKAVEAARDRERDRDVAAWSSRQLGRGG